MRYCVGERVLVAIEEIAGDARTIIEDVHHPAEVRSVSVRRSLQI
jgi:hypothetical protein